MRSPTNMRTPQLARFEKATPSSEPEESADLTAGWADDRTVCHCTHTSKGTIVSCLAKCQYDPDLIADRTGASTKCGTCLPLVEGLCATTPRLPESKKASTTLRVVTILVLALASFAIWHFTSS